MKTCPLCQELMLVRKVQRGGRAGHHFWGCSAFPECRHTEEIQDVPLTRHLILIEFLREITRTPPDRRIDVQVEGLLTIDGLRRLFRVQGFDTIEEAIQWCAREVQSITDTGGIYSHAGQLPHWYADCFIQFCSGVYSARRAMVDELLAPLADAHNQVTGKRLAELEMEEARIVEGERGVDPQNYHARLQERLHALARKRRDLERRIAQDEAYLERRGELQRLELEALTLAKARQEAKRVTRFVKAIESGDIAAIREHLKRGTDILHRPFDDTTTCEYAMKRGNDQIRDLLSEAQQSDGLP